MVVSRLCQIHSSRTSHYHGLIASQFRPRAEFDRGCHFAINQLIGLHIHGLAFGLTFFRCTMTPCMRLISWVFRVVRRAVAGGGLTILEREGHMLIGDLVLPALAVEVDTRCFDGGQRMLFPDRQSRERRV